MLPIMPLIGLAIQFAPHILSAFAGPAAGQIATKVAGAVKDIAGTDDPAQAQAKLSADPALAQALVARINAEVTAAQAAYADTADARAMGLGLVQAHHWTGNMPAIVVLLIIAMQIALTASIFLIPGDITDRMFQLLTAAFGTSSTAFGMALSYYIGSSSRSAQKDNTIAAMAGGTMGPLVGNVLSFKRAA